MQPTEDIEITCPSCGVILEIRVDSGAAGQKYVQDCEVCCRPMVITAAIDLDGELVVDVRAENE